MTAEIALLNREAVALAADSAVTMRAGMGFKVLLSANKIFALSKYRPVGVMLYGNAQLLGTPWELVIKSYRAQLGINSFSHVEDYARDFMRYLSASRAFFPEDAQTSYLLRLVRENLTGLRDDILGRVEAVIADAASISQSDIAKQAEEVIEAHSTFWKAVPAPSMQAPDLQARLLARYTGEINEIIDSVFERLPISSAAKAQLVEFSACIATKFTPGPGESEAGLVFAGYGEEDVYPSLRSYRLESVLVDELICTEDRQCDVQKVGAGVLPFAQSEMVFAFMEGVQPTYQEKVHYELAKLLTDIVNNAAKKSGLKAKRLNAFKEDLKEQAIAAMREFQAKTEESRRQQFADPALSVVGMLPKDELAAMAESLVNLTAFRRRMSLEMETVGGPIDVAVISKGDGFIWIKRKHYFAPELNPQFIQNYFRGSTS